MENSEGSKKSRSITIELDVDRCIGKGVCATIGPGNFHVSGEKAELVQGELEGNRWVKKVSCDDEECSKTIAAGEACPVNAIRITDSSSGRELVGTEVRKDEMEVVRAKYDDLEEFVMDPEGYFLIDVDRSKKEIMVGFCPEVNKVTVKIVGKKPLEIYQTIIKKGPLSWFDHAAYLGRELQKAFIALQERIVYVQDDGLDFSKGIS